MLAYIHYPGPQYVLWHYCVYPRERDVLLRITLLYMGYEVLEYVPGSPITRYVRYPDSLVPNTYATPPVTGYLERPLPGMPITQYILAPFLADARLQRRPLLPDSEKFRYFSQK